MRIMIWQILKDRMKKELKIRNDDMAYRIGRSPAALSQYLNGKNELDFYNIDLLVKELYKDPLQQEEVMKQVALSVERPDNIKCAIEFASFSEYVDILEKLLIIAENHDNRDLHDWEKVYKIHLKYLKGEISSSKMAAMSKHSKSEKKELRFFIKWMESYGYYKSLHYSILPALLDELGNLINNIDNAYIVKTYTVRLKTVSGNYYLFNNELENARHCYNSIINNSLSLVKIGRAYHGLGLTYMYSDKENSYKHIKMAIDIFTKLDKVNLIENAKHAFNIVSNYYNGNEFYEYEECLGLSIEKIHRNIKIGNKKRAEALINKIDFNSLDIRNKAFYNLYKGMLYDDIDMLYMSILYFKQYNNKFFSLLSCKELLARNERKSAIYAAYGEVFEL